MTFPTEGKTQVGWEEAWVLGSVLASFVTLAKLHHSFLKD